MYFTYLGEVSLELIAGVHLVAYLVGEGVVDLVPVVQGQVGGLLQQTLDPVSHVSRGVTLRLRTLHVVVAEPSPRLRHRVASQTHRHTGRTL